MWTFYSALLWTFIIGPDTIPNPRPGLRCQLSQITAFAHTPVATQTIYAATAEAGLLRSDRSGEPGSWLKVAPTITASPALSNLHSVAVSPNDVNRVFVATKGSNGVYRSSNGGLTWQQLDVPGTCTTAGLDSLPTGMDVRLLMTTDTQLFAATDTDGLRPSAKDGIYMSLDGGNCWKRIDDAKTYYVYHILVAVPGQPDQLLTTTQDKTLPSSMDSYALWLVRLASGRDVKPLHISELSPKTIYIEPDKPPRWYAITVDGVAVRGVLDGSGYVETLPTLRYCWTTSWDSFCFVAMVPQSMTSNAPLMLARDRLYKLGTVPWYNTIFPQSP